MKFMEYSKVIDLLEHDFQETSSLESNTPPFQGLAALPIITIKQFYFPHNSYSPKKIVNMFDQYFFVNCFL